MSIETFTWQEPGTWRKPCIVHVTMAAKDRQPLFGTLVCREGKAEVEKSRIGWMLIEEEQRLLAICPEVKILADKVMPDHHHIILQVTRTMPRSIREVVRGYMQGCKAAARELGYTEPLYDGPPYFRVLSHRGQLENMIRYVYANAERAWAKQQHPDLFRLRRQTEVICGGRVGGCNPPGKDRTESLAISGGGVGGCNPPGKDRTEGLAISGGGVGGCNSPGKDRTGCLAISGGGVGGCNPPEKDRTEGLAISGECNSPEKDRTEGWTLRFSSMGNHFLLDWPEGQHIVMSRSASEAQIAERQAEALRAALGGAVTYTAAISEGEKRIAKVIREAGFPLVIIMAEGFPAKGSEAERYYKPGGVYFNACSEGRLLLLEPEPQTLLLPEIQQQVQADHRAKAGARHSDCSTLPTDSQRYRFLACNIIGRALAGGCSVL